MIPEEEIPDKLRWRPVGAMESAILLSRLLPGVSLARRTGLRLPGGPEGMACADAGKGRRVLTASRGNAGEGTGTTPLTFRRAGT